MVTQVMWVRDGASTSRLGPESWTAAHRLSALGSGVSTLHLTPDCVPGLQTDATTQPPPRYPRDWPGLGIHTWGRRHPGWTGASQRWEVFLGRGAGKGPQRPWEPGGFFGGAPCQGWPLCMSIDDDSYWPFCSTHRSFRGLLSPKRFWGAVRGQWWGQCGTRLLRAHLLFLANLGGGLGGGWPQQRGSCPSGHAPQLLGTKATALLLCRGQATLPSTPAPLPSLPRGLAAPTSSLGPWSGWSPLLAATAVPGRDEAWWDGAGLGCRGHQGREVLLLEGVSAPGGTRVHQR